MTARTFKRRPFRIVRPRLQWTLIGSFFGLSALALLLQAGVFTLLATRAATQLPSDSADLIALLRPGVTLGLAVSFLVLLPATFFVGVLVTRRIAGPIYRIETHLKQVLAGEATGPCRLRQGDELQELCELVNRALPVVERGAASSTSSETRAAA